MALTLATAMRNAIADAVDTQLGAAATMEFQTSGNSEIATIALGNPAFGAAAAGVITLSGTPLQDTNATGGTMAKFKLKVGGTTDNIEGTVATPSGGDINFPGSLVVGAGETVEITSFTITCPAS